MILSLEIGRFRNLNTLGFQGNKIFHKNVADELSSLTNLHHLYFASVYLYNPLGQIPIPIFSLINLTDITLSKCSITYVSPLIGKLINLSRLHLEENYISSLPSEMIKLKKLNQLYLTDNPLPRKFKKINSNAQLLLKNIYYFYKPREIRIRRVLFFNIYILKQLKFHKDLIPKLIKDLWETRQDPIWKKVWNRDQMTILNILQ